MFGLSQHRFSLIELAAFSTCFVCSLQSTLAQESYPTNPQLERQQMLRARALDRIGAQVDSRSDAYLGDAKTQSERLQTNSTYAFNSLHAQNQRTLETMRNARMYVKSVAVPTYSASDIEMATENFRLQEEAYGDISQAKATQLQMEAARRTALYRDERKNLESQFTNANIGSARLTPLGTNLYVRNYELAGGADRDDAYSKGPTLSGLSAGKMKSSPFAPGGQNASQKSAGAPVPMQAKAMTLKDTTGNGQALSATRAVRTTVTGTLVH
jgi:hypothetical protein